MLFNTRLSTLVISAAAALMLGACSCGESTARKKAPDGASTSFSKSFTTADDFRKGTLHGVSGATEGSIQLETALANYATPYLYIPNSLDNSLSLIETATATVLATYDLKDSQGRVCQNPSRTTVDLNYDVWVGCRGFDSYCNRPGGTTGGTCPSMAEPAMDNKVMKFSLKERKVVLSVVVGNAPRAIAIDKDNHIWIGSSVDDTVWEIDGATGACYRGESAGCAKPVIRVADFPYGAAIDQKGMLWVVNKGTSSLHDTENIDKVTRIDIATGAPTTYGPFPRGDNGCSLLYGIAIDPLGDIWLGGHGCRDVVKLRGRDGSGGAAGSLISAYNGSGGSSKGVAVDLAGDVWVAASATTSGQNGTVFKLSGATGALLETVPIGKEPIGVAVDAPGYVWGVNRYSNNITRITTGTAHSTTEHRVGREPYSYSDMLGLALRMITHNGCQTGTWRVEVEGDSETAYFTRLSWHSSLPLSTTVGVRIRCADSKAGLKTATWGAELTQPGDIDCGNGRFLEAEVKLSSCVPNATPALYDFTVFGEK